MLEEEAEKEKNGKPAWKTSRSQHFQNLQHWTAAKMRWCVAALICGVISTADAFNLLGNACRVASTEGSWATAIAYDLLQSERIQGEARARANACLAGELKTVDKKRLEEARREKERRTEEMKATEHKKGKGKGRAVLTPNPASRADAGRRPQQDRTRHEGGRRTPPRRHRSRPRGRQAWRS